MGLCGGCGKLWSDVERVAGKNGLPGLHLSRFADGNGGDLRNLGYFEHSRECGGLGGRDGGAEDVIGGKALERLRQTLWSFDVWTNELAEIGAGKPRAGCRACGEHDFVHLAGEGRPHITMCGRNSVQIHERSRPIDFAEMQRQARNAGRGPTQRICAEVLARTLRNDSISGWPGHHQRHDGHRSGSKFVRAICGKLSGFCDHRTSSFNTWADNS